jgi:hypothetical protein
MSRKIFISYRRDDEPHAAGRLFDRLEDAFGQEDLFFDIDSIPPGKDFVGILQQRISDCDVVLAVIGREWLNILDESGARRLDNPDDFVRIELASALTLKKLIIPVLISEVPMPRSYELPKDLESLARRNALRLTHARFSNDAANLIKQLNLIFDRIEKEREEEERLEKERVGKDRERVLAAAASGQKKMFARMRRRDTIEGLDRVISDYPATPQYDEVQDTKYGKGAYQRRYR